MSVMPGTYFGPYEILDRLGAGGMGEVYRACDARLGREVALKILPADVLNEPSRRQRFELEARAVAALNHPNIVAIYDVGEGYIVSELVDGEPLRARDLSIRKTLDIASQVAAGIAAAHDAGIVHRDLKPDNILLTRDGRVKIVDFGIAKLRAQAAGATDTVTLRTDPGTVIGTVGYMSPEQVRGVEADHRSDIFSLGVVLHELLSGQRPFHGETSVDTMQAILRQDPPELPETVPAGLRQIVVHCLEKEPAKRFQSARDLGFALTQAATPTGAARALARPLSWPKWTVIAAATLAFAVLLALLLRPAAQSPEWSGVMLGGPEMSIEPRPSPDGHLIAFQAMDRGMTQVAVLKPETGNWSILTHRRDNGAVDDLSWSPDGSLIFFDRFTDVFNGVYSVPVLGGDEHLVLENAGVPEALPDGSLLLARVNQDRRLQLYHYWPETARLQALPIGIELYANTDLRAMPGGREAIVLGTPLTGEHPQKDLYIVDLATAAIRPLASGRHFESAGRFTLSRGGESILLTETSDSITRVRSMPLDGRSPPRTLFTTTEAVWHLDSGLGGVVYAGLIQRPGEVVRLSTKGGSETLARFPGLDTFDFVLVLPDGRAVVPVRGPTHTKLMAVTNGKEPTPMVATTEETAAPLTLAGPRQIAFVIGRAPHETIAIADTQSGSILRRLTPAKGPIASLGASPDGLTLYFAAGGTIRSMPANGGDPRNVTPGDNFVIDPLGRYLIVARNSAAQVHLFRVPLDGASEQEIPFDRSLPFVSNGLQAGALDAKGRLLLGLNPFDSWFNPMGLLDTATGKIARIPCDPLSDHQSAAWTADGQIISSQLGLRATLWAFTPRAR
jgi:serine/threonine protein kinase